MALDYEIAKETHGFGVFIGLIKEYRQSHHNTNHALECHQSWSDLLAFLVNVAGQRFRLLLKLALAQKLKLAKRLIYGAAHSADIYNRMFRLREMVTMPAVVQRMAQSEPSYLVSIFLVHILGQEIQRTSAF